MIKKVFFIIMIVICFSSVSVLIISANDSNENVRESKTIVLKDNNYKNVKIRLADVFDKHDQNRKIAFMQEQNVPMKFDSGKIESINLNDVELNMLEKELTSTDSVQKRTFLPQKIASLVQLEDGKWELQPINFDDDGKMTKIEHFDHTVVNVTYENGVPIVNGSSIFSPDTVKGNAWLYGKGHQGNQQLNAWGWQHTVDMYYALRNSQPTVNIINIILALNDNNYSQSLGYINMWNTVKSNADRSTDQGFGLAEIFGINGKVINCLDWYFNDSFPNQKDASHATFQPDPWNINAPGGSKTNNSADKRGYPKAMNQDFYEGWSCNYFSNGRWANIGGNSKSY